MFIYSRILKEEEEELMKKEGLKVWFRSSASGSMFHYTVLNLFIHHFSIQNPFSHNINAPTELKCSAGGGEEGGKKTVRENKNTNEGAKNKTIFYKKTSSM